MIGLQASLEIRSYAWPGNVRELRNLAERLILVATGDVIGVEDLPEDLAGAPRPTEDLYREFDSLAQGLAMLTQILDPGAIVLGTIVRENPELFLDELRQRVYEQVWPSLRNVRIESAQLGARLPAYASVCVAALEPPDLSPPGSSSL